MLRESKQRRRKVRGPGLREPTGGDGGWWQGTPPKRALSTWGPEQSVFLELGHVKSQAASEK